MRKLGCGSACFCLAVLLATLVAPPNLAANSLDTWFARSATPTGANLVAVAYGNGRFVTFTDTSKKLFTSTNGTDWQMHPAPYPNFKSLAFLNGSFLSVYAPYGSQPECIYSSSDGVSWTLKFTAATSATDIRALEFGNGTFLALGTSALVSSDLATWTTALYETANFYDVAFGNGVFVAAEYGSPDSLLTSPDGANWTYRRVGLERYGQVCFGNGKFVTASYPTGKSLVSTDGVNWTYSPGTNLLSPFTLGVKAFGGGYFVCLPTSGSSLLASTNGLDWQLHDFGTNWVPNGIAYGNSTFVAVGNGSAILQSAPVVSPAPPPQPSLVMTQPGVLRLTGQTGQYRIECTDSLAATNSFRPLATVYLDTSPLEWLDTTATNAPRRFYRATSP